MIRCVIGDRSVVFAEGLASVLSRSGEVVVVGSTNVPEDVPGLVNTLRPDVVIASFEPPAVSLGLAHLVHDRPVLLLTWSRREDDLIEALRAGAGGLVHKDAEPAEILAAIHDVAAGRSAFPAGWERLLVSRLDGHTPSGTRRRRDAVSLTQRERDIVQLIVDGHSNKALAAALGIAHQTAKNHVRHVMAKARVSSRTQLCAWAIERGYSPTQTAATA
jgi:DNA-binding NarL/FixJ family response regulator